MLDEESLTLANLGNDYEFIIKKNAQFFTRSDESYIGLIGDDVGP